MREEWRISFPASVVIDVSFNVFRLRVRPSVRPSVPVPVGMCAGRVTGGASDYSAREAQRSAGHSKIISPYQCNYQDLKSRTKQHPEGTLELRLPKYILNCRPRGRTDASGLHRRSLNLDQCCCLSLRYRTGRHLLN